MEDFCDAEWKIVEDIYNDFACGDTPFYLLELSFDKVMSWYRDHKTLPPSLILQDVLTTLLSYRDIARTDRSREMFEEIAQVTEYVLCQYLGDILFIKEEDIQDYAYLKVAIPEYYTEDEYAYMRSEYECNA